MGFFFLQKLFQPILKVARNDFIVLGFFLLLQRNHTLFGSVWSSLKRKRISLSGKHGLSIRKTKKKLQTNSYDDGGRDTGARDEEEGRAGLVGESGVIGIDNLGDPVNSMTGELQTRVQQNIPMRPLVINSNNNQNYNMNVSQNVPCNE